VAQALADRLRAQGRNAACLAYEGSSRTQLSALVGAATEMLGGLDILIHNAGGCPWSAISALTEETLEDALAINLKACFWLAQAAHPHLKRGGAGRIIITSSVSARVAMAGGAHYSAAKAGVNAFIRGAAFEYARDGVTVNGVEPGFIAKPGRGTTSAPERMAAISRHIPMGRFGEADDIAHAMVFLASEESKYMTGQTIVIDGGSTLPETGYAVETLWP
jgi:3-oxoacyl-[acyl-carrier protein] reductase